MAKTKRRPVSSGQLKPKTFNSPKAGFKSKSMLKCGGKKK